MDHKNLLTAHGTEATQGAVQSALGGLERRDPVLAAERSRSALESFGPRAPSASADAVAAPAVGCAPRGPAATTAAPSVSRKSEHWIAQAPGRWWVLHTRARNEKRIAEILEEHQVCHYLPLVSVHRTYTKSRFTFRVPLFPGYLFLCGDHGTCDTARRTNRVANIIHVDNQDQLRAELQHIYRVVESRQAVDLFPALRVGQRCRIAAGALKGLEGVVIRRGGHCRMYLAVSTLGQSAVVEVDAALLEAVN